MPSPLHYAVLFGITFAIEGALLMIFMGRRGWRWSLALNLFTHPLAVFAHALFLPLGPALLLQIEARWGVAAMTWLDLLSLELCVIAVEALCLAWGAGLGRFKALWLATLINLVSASSGPLLDLLRRL